MSYCETKMDLHHQGFVRKFWTGTARTSASNDRRNRGEKMDDLEAKISPERKRLMEWITSFGTERGIPRCTLASQRHLKISSSISMLNLPQRISNLAQLLICRSLFLL